MWQRVFAELAKDADFEEVFLDITIVRAHRHAAGAPQKNGPQALARSGGGLITKIHALVEGLGQLARFALTPGQAGDITEAHGLLRDVGAQAEVADTAFDAGHLREAMAARTIKAVMPSHPTCKVQRHIVRHKCRHRNLVERWFARIKQFRRIATGYDKLASGCARSSR